MADYILHRKERLIITTIDLIDELGIQGLSTREIARREGVSEATLFRHFKNKNELLLAVLEYYTKFDADLLESARLKNLKPRDSMVYLVRSYAEYYESYPAITSVMQLLDVLRYEGALAEKIKSIKKVRMESFKQIIDNAQKTGEMRPGFDSESMALVINGMIREFCLKWRIEGHTFSLRDKILLTLGMILDALATA